MPELVTRAQWKARAPRSRVSLKTAKGNTVHYEGGPLGDYGHDRCPSMVRAIQNYHMDHQGWADIAYSTITCRHGTVFDCRGYNVRTAAQGSQQGNDTSYAHCVMIGAGDTLPEEAMDSLRWAVLDYEARGSGTQRWVHSDWHSTGCPGDLLRAWVREGLPDRVPVLPPPLERTPLEVNAPQVTILNHPDWDGYLQVCSDGGVIQQGAPPFYGSLGGTKLNAPVVDADVMPDGRGYVMLGADGGVFSFGSSEFEGSHGPETENAPFVSITVTKTGKGYWLGGRDGGVFNYGDAEFKGAAHYGGA